VAQAAKTSEERAQLSDGEREAFQEIFDLLIPEDFRILSYTKKRVIRSMMKIIEGDIAVIRLKLRKIQKIFERLTEKKEEPEEGEK